jgi:hypothetical protein
MGGGCGTASPTSLAAVVFNGSSLTNGGASCRHGGGRHICYLLTKTDNLPKRPFGKTITAKEGPQAFIAGRRILPFCANLSEGSCF